MSLNRARAVAIFVLVASGCSPDNPPSTELSQTEQVTGTTPGAPTGDAVVAGPDGTSGDASGDGVTVADTSDAGPDAAEDVVADVAPDVRDVSDGGQDLPPNDSGCTSDDACPAFGLGPCEVPACLDDGSCGVRAAAEGATCDDQSVCTVDDACAAGVCSGEAVDCPSDACNEAICDAIKGCGLEPVADGKVCNDENPCTGGDQCLAGLCVGATDTCTCDVDADCEAFIVDLCAPPLECVGSVCVATDGPGLVCPPSVDSCSVNACNPATGLCEGTPEPDGAACGSVEPCGLGGVCAEGSCAAQVVPCEDDDPCTESGCDAAGACVHSAAAPGIECDDGDPCTAGDACDGAGSCTPGSNSCDCLEDTDCTGDSCLGTWTCQDNVCVVDSEAAVDCSDLDAPCLKGVCTDGACAAEPIPDQEPCEDGDACTQGSTCAAGICSSGSELPCDDDNGCTNDSCDSATGCVFAPNSQPCDDSNACTSSDTCVAGACVGGSAVVCEQPGGCQTATCDPQQGCMTSTADDGAPCDDGEPCTAADVCTAGQCAGQPGPCPCSDDGDCIDNGNVCDGTPVCGADGFCAIDPATVIDCGVVPACQYTACEPSTGSCSLGFDPNGTACDAGVCRTPGSCQAGLCASDPVDCEDGNDCTANSCSPMTGTCVLEVRNGEACDDGDACTDGDSCTGASCSAGDPLTCDDSDPCTVNACEPAAGCDFSELITCMDDDPCTLDVCVAGQGCDSSAVDACDDQNACTADTCEAGVGCVHTDLVCDDGLECTLNECDVLAGCQHPEVACTDDNLCTTDLCSEGEGCKHAPVVCPDEGGCVTLACAPDTGLCEPDGVTPGVVCDDDNPCTGPDVCHGSGVCQGAPLPGGTACDDANADTRADMCVMGTCAGYQLTAHTHPANLGQYWYTDINAHDGEWWAAAGAVSFGQYSALLSNVTVPGGANIDYATLRPDPWRQIHGGFALNADLEVRERSGNSWAFGDFSQAILNGPDGEGRSLWSWPMPNGHTRLWVVGTRNNGDPLVRYCVEGGTGVSCGGQELESIDALPRAVAGSEICGAVGACAPTLALGADFDSGSGYFNDALDNVGGNQDPWTYGYYDPEASTSETRDVAGYGDGRFLIVGSAGYLRVGSSGGWADQLWLSNAQGQRSFEGVWIGADVVVVAASAPETSGAVSLELWTVARDADPSLPDNWTIHQLGKATGGDVRALFDVWGLDSGQIRAVGGGNEGNGSSRGLLFVRSP